MHSSRGRHLIPTSEQDLVRALLMAMQGVTSELVAWDAGRRAFVVSEALALPAPARQLAARVCEAGWLYRRVRRWCDECADPATGAGPVEQALGGAVRAELDAYHQALGGMGARAVRGVTSGSAGGGVGNKVPEAAAGSVEPPEAPLFPGLTLRRLALWAAEPVRRLSIIAQMLDAAGSLRGAAAVTQVWRFTGLGDPVLAGIAERLAVRGARPIFAAMRTWVREGRLGQGTAGSGVTSADMGSGTFFVRARPGIPADRLWQDRYRLDGWRRPGFLGRAECRLVYRIGKNLNFLLECCGDQGWVAGTRAGDAPRGIPQGTLGGAGGMGAGAGGAGAGAGEGKSSLDDEDEDEDEESWA